MQLFPRPINSSGSSEAPNCTSSLSADGNPKTFALPPPESVSSVLHGPLRDLVVGTIHRNQYLRHWFADLPRNSRRRRTRYLSTSHIETASRTTHSRRCSLVEQTGEHHGHEKKICKHVSVDRTAVVAARLSFVVISLLYLQAMEAMQSGMVLVESKTQN